MFELTLMIKMMISILWYHPSQQTFGFVTFELRRVNLQCTRPTIFFIPIIIFYAQQWTDLLCWVCVPTLLTHCSIQEVAQLEFLITYSFSHLTNALCNAAGRESRPPAGFYVNPCNRSFTGSKLGELFQNLGPKKIGALKWRSFLQQYQLSSF